jgi:hypothetical protein
MFRSSKPATSLRNIKRFKHQKLQQKDPKQLAKNIKPVVQHHTLHGDPCTTNILNFLLFLRNNIIRRGGPNLLLTVKFRQPSHEFTFGVGMTFVSYPLVLTPVV